MQRATTARPQENGSRRPLEEVKSPSKILTRESSASSKQLAPPSGAQWPGQVSSGYSAERPPSKFGGPGPS
eukprot:3737150-Pyramimonas_sp.AAC.1